MVVRGTTVVPPFGRVTTDEPPIDWVSLTLAPDAIVVEFGAEPGTVVPDPLEPAFEVECKPRVTRFSMVSQARDKFAKRH